MKTALVDANVILRFITKDPPEMADAARNLFKQAEAGEIGLIILTITVAEVVWVLESFYSYAKIHVAETFGAFLRCDGLQVEQANLIQEALSLYQKATWISPMPYWPLPRCVRDPFQFIPLIATLIVWQELNVWNPLLQNQVGEKNLNGNDAGEDQKEEDRSQGQFFLNTGQ